MMNNFQRLIFVCAVLLGSTVLATAQQAVSGYEPAVKKEIGHLKNLYEIDSGVYRSEQPRRRSFPALEKAGIREILNLRRHKNKDRKRSGQHDFILHQVPLKARDINEANVIEALRIIKDRQGPILIHCWAGADRTGLISAMYRIVFDHWSKEAAIHEMEYGGFGFHKRYKEVPAYIRQADIERIRKQLSE